MTNPTGPDGDGLAPGRLRSVLEHIDAHLARRLVVAELAAVARLSPFHFCRVFRRSTGLSPHRFIVERRIERACTLVRDSDQPFAEIATTVGFADQSHFSRTFARVARETPRRYRYRNR